MSPAARMNARYIRLKGQHRCVRCAEKLPRCHTAVRCNDCLAASAFSRRANTGHRSVERLLNLNAELARIVETYGKLSADAQAELLGVRVSRVYYLRNLARKRGHDVPVQYGGRTDGHHSSPAWAALDATTERCECGLLKPCEDCGPTVYQLASARRYVSPA